MGVVHAREDHRVWQEAGCIYLLKSLVLNSCTAVLSEGLLSVVLGITNNHSLKNLNAEL